MAPATYLSTRPCANSANGGLIPTQDQVEDALLLRRQEPESMSEENKSCPSPIFPGLV